LLILCLATSTHLYPPIPAYIYPPIPTMLTRRSRKTAETLFTNEGFTESHAHTHSPTLLPDLTLTPSQQWTLERYCRTRSTLTRPSHCGKLSSYDSQNTRKRTSTSRRSLLLAHCPIVSLTRPLVCHSLNSIYTAQLHSVARSLLLSLSSPTSQHHFSPMSRVERNKEAGFQLLPQRERVGPSCSPH
jgi:hypothetical protein